MNNIMKAIRVAEFGGPEVLKLVSDVPMPTVNKGQVSKETYSTKSW